MRFILAVAVTVALAAVVSAGGYGHGGGGYGHGGGGYGHGGKVRVLNISFICHLYHIYNYLTQKKYIQRSFHTHSVIPMFMIVINEYSWTLQIWIKRVTMIFNSVYLN